MPLRVNDNIVWLQISEYDVTLVKVLNSEENLSDIDPRSVFRKSLLFGEKSRHVATRTVLKDQEQFLIALEGIV